MSSDLQRFFCDPITQPTVELSETEAHHLTSVYRLRQDQKVELFDGYGTLAVASLRDNRKKSVILNVEKITVIKRPQNKQIIIAAGIAKGDRFDWLLEKCTELGIDRVCPVLFERTVKQPQNPKIMDRWTNLTIAAAKQCKRLFLPIIDQPATLAELLATLRNDSPETKFIFGSFAENSTPLLNLPFTGNIAAFIGPEGGLTDAEETLLKNSAAQPVKLTSTILRIETAALALASILAISRDAADAK